MGLMAITSNTRKGRKGETKKNETGHKGDEEGEIRSTKRKKQRK